SPEGVCGPRGATSDEAAVETVTVAVEAPEPLSVNEFGLIAHTECAGAPVQPRFTAWLNPPAGECVDDLDRLRQDPGLAEMTAQPLPMSASSRYARTARESRFVSG